MTTVPRTFLRTLMTNTWEKKLHLARWRDGRAIGQCRGSRLAGSRLPGRIFLLCAGCLLSLQVRAQLLPPAPAMLPIVPAIPMGSGTAVPRAGNVDYAGIADITGPDAGIGAVPVLHMPISRMKPPVAGKTSAVRAARPDPVADLRREVDELKQRARVAEAVGAATQKPARARFAGAATVYDFVDGGVYQVYAAPERVTDIVLQPGEKPSGAPIGGDTARWILTSMKTGVGSSETWHVVVKPVDENIETNILIPTDRRVYRLQVRASPEWFMPGVSWTYPADEAASREVLFAARQREERQREPIAFAPEKLDFSYVVEGSNVEWKPVRVFNDGSKTFLQMPVAMKAGDAPALFVIEDGGEPMLVNYRVKDGVYMVDRLFRTAEMRVGPKQRVTIRHEVASRGFWGSAP